MVQKKTPVLIGTFAPRQRQLVGMDTCNCKHSWLAGGDRKLKSSRSVYHVEVSRPACHTIEFAQVHLILA